jgi:AraC-like DNA-binding protein
MRQNLADPHCLRDHAHAGLLSPFHFHRVFRMVTAATPARFLAALRMAEAQRLLVRSRLRVTDIALRVGYSSLSSFTAQFTRLVGFSPRRFRILVARAGDLPVGVAARSLEGQGRPEWPVLTTVVRDVANEALFTGLFPYGIPQGRPASGAVTTGDEKLYLPLPSPGYYQLLSVSFAPDRSIADTLADTQGSYRRVAALPGPVRICNEPPAAPCHLWLRQPQLTDPPIVVALPLLGVESALEAINESGMAAARSASQEKPPKDSSH